MVHSEFQTIKIAGAGRDNTGTHPTSRTTSYKLAEKIFHSILAVGELPAAWRGTKVVFIPKAGKATHTTAKDFRPISLTSFLLKSFEKMISLHIKATIDPTQISEAQHAFTKGKSIESALHLVVSSIEKSLSIKEYTLIAFLDIEGAFNNVLPIAITESLTELGVDPPMVGLIHKLLISRMVTATLGPCALKILPCLHQR